MDRKPYLLRPDKPPEGELRPIRDGETETEVNQAMPDRAKGAGLEIHRPHWSPDTKLAHEATAFAKEKGKDSEFHHILAKAYWTTGADLADAAVLRGAAQESGLDWDELAPKLESRQYLPGVMEEREAAKTRGVGGTPSYLIGGELLGGDISLEDLAAAIKKAGQT